MLRLSRKAAAMRFEVLFRVLTVALAAGLAGCSFFLSAETGQCKADGECSKLPYAPNTGSVCQNNVCVGQWTCIDDPAPTYDKTKMYTVQAPLLNFTDKSTPVPGIKVDVCGVFDPACRAPNTRAVSDGSGIVTFQVVAGFQGYLLTSDPNTDPNTTMTPSIIVISSKVISDRKLNPTFLVPAQAIPALASAFKVNIDAERGFLEFTTFDCQGKPAAGVAATVDNADAETTTLYQKDQSLQRIDATTTDGFGGMANVAAGNGNGDGNVTLSLKLNASGTPLGSFGVKVRKGTITIATIDPHAANAK